MSNAAHIHVRFTQSGFHFWPSAPEHRSYLAQPHRHMFHVEVTMAVHHDDREVEFHDLRDKAVELFASLGGASGNMGAMSCEHMARSLGDSLAQEFGRGVVVSVWEDGECGSTVKTHAPQ